jgi:hypothetical protein
VIDKNGSPNMTQRTDEAKQDQPANPRKTLFKGWRIVAFLLIGLAMIALGFHYKGLADPGAESRRFAAVAPQEIDIFVSNAGMSVTAEASIYRFPAFAVPGRPVPRSPLNEDLDMSVKIPASVKAGSLLILTNIPGEIGDENLEGCKSPPGKNQYNCGSYRLSATSSRIGKYSDIPGGPSGIYYAYTVSVRLAKRHSTATEISSGSFPSMLFSPIPADLQGTRAFIFGHLPSVGAIDASMRNSGLDIFAESYGTSTPQIRDIKIDATSDMFVLVNNKLEGSHGGPATIFNAPDHFSIKETQASLASLLANQQVNHMAPAGVISGQDYIWRGNGYLSPIFQVTNLTVAAGESNSAFLSGIFFAVAGAAAIALVQEIPKEFNQPAWWIHRKGRQKDSLDEKPERTA